MVCAAGVPLIFYLHGPAYGRHWLELWARHTLPDMIVCNSRFTAATVDHLYPSVPTEIVYCPVASPKLSHSQADINRIRADLKTPKDATVIIQVSRMEEGKGQTNHLEALSLLKDLPDWICWLVGSPQRSDEKKYLQRLQKMAGRLGIAERVYFLNQSANVGELLAAADIFCQPHTGPESFGIVFIEALYAQLPVVTTGLGGACEIVDDSCGVLVPHHDARALANALQLLIENRSLRRRLGAAGTASKGVRSYRRLVANPARRKLAGVDPLGAGICESGEAELDLKRSMSRLSLDYDSGWTVIRFRRSRKKSAPAYARGQVLGLQERPRIDL